MIEVTILMLGITVVFGLIISRKSEAFVAKDRIDLMYNLNTDVLFWYNLDTDVYGSEFNQWKMDDESFKCHIVKIGEL